MKSPVRNMMLALAVLSVAFCGFVGLSVLRMGREANARLNEFKELGASRNPTATFESLQRKYGGKLHKVKGSTPQACQYEMNLSNRIISALHIVPYTEMNIWFTVDEGSLRWAMLEYRTALTGPNSPVVHVQQGMCAHGCGVRFDVNPHGTAQQVWNGLVEFDTRATAQQRDAALALNLDCFVRIGGCRDIVDLLPTVWMRTGPRTITSRLVGSSQRLEESHEFPSPDGF